MAEKNTNLPHRQEGRRDARCYPRFRAQLPAQLVTPTGENLVVSTRIISMVGLEVSCEQRASLQVLTKDNDKPASQRRVLHFSLALPDNESTTIGGTAFLVNSRRVAQNRYVLAIQYLKLSTTDREHLAAFLEECSVA